MKGLVLMAYQMLRPVVAWLRSREIVFKLLFGVNEIPENVHYDTTTMLFRKALEKEVNPASRVLEMGIGQAGLLSLYLARKKNLKPFGVDVSAARVASSLTAAKNNNIDADFWQSDLFSNVNDSYDVIFFNPPYVDRKTGEELKLSERLGIEGDAAWNGGEDGTEIIQRFLAASAIHLQKQGKVMIGVQSIYVSARRLEQLAASARFYIAGSFSSWLNPSKIYVLKFRD